MNFSRYLPLFKSVADIHLLKKSFVYIISISLGFVIYSGTVLAAQNEGLLPVEGTSFDVFKISDGIAFPASKKIYIEDVQASFSKEWMSKFRSKTSKRYREKTLHDYAQAFREQLAKKLSSAGWSVTDQAEETALRARATLSNIKITAPELLLISNSLVLDIGSSSFELSILDANEQAMLYIQHEDIVSSISSSFIETDNAMNFSRFNKLFSAWANNFTVFFNMVSELTVEQNR